MRARVCVYGRNINPTNSNNNDYGDDDESTIIIYYYMHTATGDYRDFSGTDFETNNTLYAILHVSARVTPPRGA